MQTTYNQQQVSDAVCNWVTSEPGDEVASKELLQALVQAGVLNGFDASTATVSEDSDCAGVHVEVVLGNGAVLQLDESGTAKLIDNVELLCSFVTAGAQDATHLFVKTVPACLAAVYEVGSTWTNNDTGKAYRVDAQRPATK